MTKFAQITAAAGIIALLGTGAAFAASADDPGIQQREQNQQNRINQGVQSGQLTPKETGKLEAQQARIQQREARMKADNNGSLTKADKHKLTKQQNRASKNIYKKKHNDNTANVK